MKVAIVNIAVLNWLRSKVLGLREVLMGKRMQGRGLNVFLLEGNGDKWRLISRWLGDWRVSAFSANYLSQKTPGVPASLPAPVMANHQSFSGQQMIRMGLILLVFLFLSGCVKYDVTVNVENENHGAIVQRIALGEQLTSFSNEQAQDWLKSIQRRTRQLEGKTKRFSNRAMVVTIPFNNGAELVGKFNQFFNANVKNGAKGKSGKSLDLPNLDSQLSLEQRNFFVAQQNHLSYQLDLRSLAVLSAKGNVIVSPGSLLDLQFSLQTPWGAKIVNQAGNTITPTISDQGQKLVWTLVPGQLNRLEVVYWVPSPLGIGAIAIIIFVLGGFYVKYKSFPWTQPSVITYQ